jgi:DNA polymerase (family 10)
MMTNIDMASLFTELADIMELAGENHFKIQAYRKAAVTIEGLDTDIQIMTTESISKIPGIGKAILEKIETAKISGNFPTLEKWRQSGYGTFLPLLKVPGLNMRIVRSLLIDLKISSIDDLCSAVVSGELEKYNKLPYETVNILKKFSIQNAK